MTEDVHTPTNAGPDQAPVEPAPVAPAAPTEAQPGAPWSPPAGGGTDAATQQAPVAPAAEPGPTVPPSQSTFTRPAGSALPSNDAAVVPIPTARPEVLVGGAFAGGFLAALILKRLGR